MRTTTLTTGLAMVILTLLTGCETRETELAGERAELYAVVARDAAGLKAADDPWQSGLIIGRESIWRDDLFGGFVPTCLGREGVSDALMEEIQAVNQRRLDMEVALGHPEAARYVSNEEIQELGGRTRLRNKYPGEHVCLVEFSEFAESDGVALVYVELNCGALAAHGGLVVLGRSGNGWEVRQICAGWAS